MRKHQYQLKLPSWQFLGGTSLIGLAGVVAALLLPIASPTAHAEPLTADLSTKTTANLYSMLSIALSNNIDIDITPKSTGAIGVGKARLNVTTNNITGYSIYLSTVDESNSLNAIDNEAGFTGAEGATYAINALEGTTTYNQYLSNQANLNTWGYALTSVDAGTDDTVYTGLDNAKGDNIYYTKSTTSNDSYDLNIAVAVDASLPAGGYRNGIVVSAVANPISISGFKSIYYMQEMTPEICAEAKEHEEGQLVDKRDHKIYWVGKLKDGNCWMTQNLDLDLSTDIALTPEDTNVTENWTPQESTSTESYWVENPLAHNTNPINSYDPGFFVVKNPSLVANCTSRKNLAGCANFQNVSQYHPGFIATETNAVDSASSTYDAHYLVGNYYQPNAALVGKGTADNINKQFTEDICPKNWSLPSGTKATGLDNFRDVDLYKLVAVYGWDSDYQPNTSWENFYFTPLSSNPNNTSLTSAPLYFTYTGNITASGSDTSLSQINNTNNIQYLAASKAGRFTSVALVVTGERLYPGTISVWSNYGLPVRCVAK